MVQISPVHIALIAGLNFTNFSTSRIGPVAHNTFTKIFHATMGKQGTCSWDDIVGFGNHHCVRR